MKSQYMCSHNNYYVNYRLNLNNEAMTGYVIFVSNRETGLTIPQNIISLKSETKS